MKTFEVGKTYTMRSIGDHDCVWTYTVVKRTAKTITISDGQETKTCRVNAKTSEIRNAESIYPLGRYSMSPVLSADAEDAPEEATIEKAATVPMKFKKQPNVAFFSRYVREDGKITITSVDRQINGTWKNVFEVTDENGAVIDVLPRLKDAKAKYETEQGSEAPIEAEEVQEAPKAAAEEAPDFKLNPMCEKCANYPTDCAGAYEQVWTGCVHRKTAPDESRTFAPKKLRTMTDDQLLTAWESTEHLEDPQCPTIRGWLMDEIERRYPVDFNAWLDQDAPEDSQLRKYIMAGQ